MVKTIEEILQECFPSIFTQETKSLQCTSPHTSRPPRRKRKGSANKRAKECAFQDSGGKKTYSYDSYHVTKSPMDKNHYKVIRFPNKLCACLTSQLDYLLSDSLEYIHPSTFCFTEVQEFNENFVQMNQNLGQDPDNMSLLERVTSFPWCQSIDEISDDDPPEDDTSEPAIKKLKYEPQPRNEKDPCTDAEFGISICVTVGSLHDPKEYAGMAHLCEHCIFEGTKAYPNSWNVLQENTLHVNAYTGKERTVYYAHTENLTQLRKVASIFADMIANPLLTDEIITREILSIDSESSMRQSNDIIRLFDLFTFLAKASHPLRRYHAGDASTLSKPKVAEALRKWHRKYYQPHNIIISIQGPIPMKDLIDLAAQYFYSLAVTKFPNSPSKEIRSFGFPFQCATYNKIYKVCPYEDIQWLLVSWTMPEDIWRNHATKPLEYVVSLLKQQGQGSLHSYLMKEHLITDSTCCCTHPGNSYVKTRLYSSLVVVFELTEKGFSRSYDVLLSLFSYLKKMRQIGPKRRVFEEIRMRRAFKFHYEDDALDFTTTSVSLHINEKNPHCILTAPALVTKYDPQAIRDCMMKLKPDNMNIMIMSKKFEKEVVQLHPNILTEFGAFSINNELLQSLENCNDYQGNFHTPKVNKYIPQDFCRPLENSVGNLSVLFCLSYLHSTGKACLVSTHESAHPGYPPTAIYTFMITSSLFPSSNSENSAYSKLWAKILTEKVFSRYYSAIDAGLRLGVSVAENGLFMYLFGLSRFLPEIWLQMLDDFWNFDVDEQMFSDFVDVEVKTYGNNSLHPMTLAQDLVTYITSTRHLLQGTLQLYIQTNASYESFMNYTKRFKYRMWICSQLFGTVTNYQLEIIAKSLAELKYNALVPQEICTNHCYILPIGEKCLRVKSMSPKCYTSFIINCYQLGNLSKEEVAACHVIAQELSSFIFDELRTKQQIGYLVWTIFDESYSVSSLKVCIQFQADRYSPGYVNEKIDEAFVNFYEKHIKRDKDLKKVLKKRCATTTAKRFGKKVHEFVQKLQKRLASKTDRENQDLDKIRQFFRSHFPTAPVAKNGNALSGVGTFRKLSVQVVGSKRNPSSCPLQAEYDDMKMKRDDSGEPREESGNANLGFLTLDTPKDLKTENGYFLTNLPVFKAQLFLYPNCGST